MRHIRITSILLQNFDFDVNLMAESKYSRNTVVFIAMTFGLLLVVASIYQIFQTVSDSNRLEQIDTQMAFMEQTRVELEGFQKQFEAVSLDLWSLDYNIAQNSTGNITEEDAIFQISRLGKRYWTLYDDFIAKYFVFQFGTEPDGISEPYYTIKPEYDWIVNKSYAVNFTDYVYNQTTFEYEEVVVIENFALLHFEYLTPPDGVPYRRHFAIETYDSNAIDGNYFTWNQTYKVLFNQTWVRPINVWFQNALYDQTLQELSTQQSELSYHIKELESALIVNSVSLLLLGFLIQLEDRKVWKILYFITALLLTIYSLFGQDLITWVVGAAA